MAVQRSEGSPDRILRPRPVKPSHHSSLLRPQDEGNHSLFDTRASGISSGASTPIPHDAPPSQQSISSARKLARAQAKGRMFHTINYTPRVSHFDARSDYRDFKGFFVLFWISLTIMVLTTFLRNIKDTGYPLRIQVWKVLSANVLQLAFSDALMVLTTGLVLPLHRLFRSSDKQLQWRKGGIAIQSVYQCAWLTLWVNWPFMLKWTWTAQVFFILHTLVLFMKIHSYAFYNGHLSTSEKRLKSLDQQPGDEALLAAAVRYPSSPGRHSNLRPDDEPDGNELKEKEKVLQLREDLATELTSPLGRVTYPQNLTWWNYCDFVMCPTLCYELEYPRTSHIRWLELFWKTLAVFGCIFLLTLTSDEFIMPVLTESATRLQALSKLTDKGLVLAESISMLLFPFVVTFLLVFLVIFEYLLGAFAEMTCFADRHFYSDWWNSSDWLEFSREWNIPVHHFLRRHVYFSSRHHFSNSVAMLITFLVSSLGHELIMGCITKKLRGYGFVAMMLQLPIVAVQRSKLVRGRWVFNNCCFWMSMISGLSVMCSLYVLV